MEKNKSNQKAQGSLEYLIIVAAVIAIVAVVIVVVSGAFTGARTSARVMELKRDASSCATLLMAEGIEPGSTRAIQSELCEEICSGPRWQTAEDIARVSMHAPTTVTTIKQACMAGKSDWIIEGSGEFRAIGECIKITEPGTYLLQKDLEGTKNGEEYCIGIFSDNVSIRGNGYELKGPGRVGGEWITAYGVYASNTENVEIQGLVIDNYWKGIRLTRSNNGHIRNNEVSNGYQGIELISSCENNLVEENEVKSNSRGITLLSSSHYNTVSKNEVLNSVSTGIWIGGVSMHNLLSENKVKNTTHWGVRITSAVGNMVEENQIINSGASGVTLVDTVDDSWGRNWNRGSHLVDQNIIDNSGGSGIKITVSGNMITNNIITNSGEEGIEIDYYDPYYTNPFNSMKNTIINNIVTNSSTDSFIARYDHEDTMEIFKNEIENLTLKKLENQVTTSFNATGIKINPSDPITSLDDKLGIGKYLEITPTLLGANMSLRIHYDEEDIEEIEEGTLTIWTKNGDWQEIGGSGVNTGEKYVYSGHYDWNEVLTLIFAPLGNPLDE